MKQSIPHSRPWITEEDCNAVDAVLRSDMIDQGAKVADFETKIKQYLGIDHAVAQASGTAALILALKTLDIAKGDEVILPTYVCQSVMEAVFSVGATARLCDVNEKGVITKDTVRPLINKNTKAIIAVHIFGHPCDIAKLQKFQVPIIEDACQAFGLVVNGKIAGTIGEIGILSFHATKCLTTGEGGMLVTNSDRAEACARRLAEGAETPMPRCIAPMSDIQAVLGISQLKRYPEFIARRSELFEQYTQAANDAGIPIKTDLRSNVPFRFALSANEDFYYLQKLFSEKKIAIRHGVDELLHRLTGADDALFPQATKLFQQTISVPFYPSLTSSEVTQIQESFQILKNNANRN